jgi:hypothetical protein
MAPAPHKGVPVLIPIGRCGRNGPADRFPGLETTAFEGERPQHLPLGLNQVEIRCILRLEDELPGRMRQREAPHIGGPMGTHVIDNRLDRIAVGGQPSLDVVQAVRPVGCRATLVWLGADLPRGRALSSLGA